MAGNKEEKQMAADAEGCILSPCGPWCSHHSRLSALSCRFYCSPKWGANLRSLSHQEKLSADWASSCRNVLPGARYPRDTPPPSPYPPRVTALNCSKECCGVGFQTSTYLRQTNQGWFPLWLRIVWKAIHRSPFQFGQSTNSFHLRWQ